MADLCKTRTPDGRSRILLPGLRQNEAPQQKIECTNARSHGPGTRQSKMFKGL